MNYQYCELLRLKVDSVACSLVLGCEGAVMFNEWTAVSTKRPFGGYTRVGPRGGIDAVWQTNKWLNAP